MPGLKHIDVCWSTEIDRSYCALVAMKRDLFAWFWMPPDDSERILARCRNWWIEISTHDQSL
jgi:hypothetical protein